MKTFLNFSIPLNILYLTFELLLLTGLLSLIASKIMRKRKWHYPLADLILLIIFLADLVIIFAYHRQNLHDYKAIDLAISVFVFLWTIMGLIKERKIYESQINRNSIREASENLPWGMGYFQKNGLRILINQKLDELAQTLTGGPIMNGRLFWQELKEMETGSFTEEENLLTFLLPDGSVWIFKLEETSFRGKQIKHIRAYEVTHFYNLTLDLHKENARLFNQSRRVKGMLANIAQTKNEEEILASRIKIHTYLGQAILASRHYLEKDHPDQEEFTELMDDWWEVINFLEAAGQENEDIKSQAFGELLQIAQKMGLEIIFEGLAFEELKKNDLLKNALREAMTNAYIHAKAEKVKVVTKKERAYLHVIISDNGLVEVESVSPGSGLSALREKVERAGGQMEIKTGRGVILDLLLPTGEECL